MQQFSPQTWMPVLLMQTAAPMGTEQLPALTCLLLYRMILMAECAHVMLALSTQMMKMAAHVSNCNVLLVPNEHSIL
jgi:hypothetical protein